MSKINIQKEQLPDYKIPLTKKIESVSTEHIMNAILKMFCIECVQIMHYPHQTMRPNNITMTK